MTIKPNSAADQQLELSYRTELAWFYKRVDYIGLPHATSKRLARLDSIYVPLTLHPALGDLSERIPVEKALCDHATLVILGTPGSGKSTLSQVLAYAFSLDAESSLTKGLGSKRIVIYLILRQYNMSNWTSLDDLLNAYIEQLPISCKDRLSPLWFQQKMREGRVILVLDGVDELSLQMQNKFLSFFPSEIMTEVFSSGGEGADPISRNQVVITSRFSSADYSKNLVTGKCKTRWHPYTINSFDWYDIQRFIRQWCGAREANLKHRELLQRNIYDSLRQYPQLKTLAESPLLLTMMALIVQAKGSLPLMVTDLYDKIIETYIFDLPIIKGFHKAVDELNISYRMMKFGLSELAWEMCSHTKDQSTMEYDRVKKILGIDFLQAEKFIQYLLEYSGLLVMYNQGQFSFAHPSFQEYLAAWKLRGLIGNISVLKEKCLQQLRCVEHHGVLLYLFELFYDFLWVADKLFEELIKDKGDEAMKAVFFSKLAQYNETILNENNKQKAIEYALIQSCSHFNISVIDSLLACSEDSDNIITAWFDKEANANCRVVPEETSFLVTSLMLYPNRQLWVDKIKDNIIVPSNIDKTNKQYLITLLAVTVSSCSGKAGQFQLKRIIEFCMSIRMLAPTKDKLKKEVINIESIMSNIAEFIPVLARRFEVAVELNVNFPQVAVLPYLYVNPIWIEAVFYNLAINALKYADPKNKTCTLTIDISAGDDDPFMHICFTDKGVGIDQEDVDSIFKKGYRAENAMRLRSQGVKLVMGLTLYECRVYVGGITNGDLVGAITLKNRKNPTVFEVSIPIIQE